MKNGPCPSRHPSARNSKSAAYWRWSRIRGSYGAGKRRVYQPHAQDPSDKLKPKVASYHQERQDGKVRLTLSTYVQNVEDFKFWADVAGRPHADLIKFLTKKSRSAISSSSMGWSQNYFVIKCIPDLLKIWTMWFAKLAKNNPLIVIIWRFRTEWRSLSRKRGAPKRKRTILKVYQVLRRRAKLTRQQRRLLVVTRNLETSSKRYERRRVLQVP